MMMSFFRVSDNTKARKFIAQTTLFLRRKNDYFTNFLQLREIPPLGRSSRKPFHDSIFMRGKKGILRNERNGAKSRIEYVSDPDREYVLSVNVLFNHILFRVNQSVITAVTARF